MAATYERTTSRLINARRVGSGHAAAAASASTRASRCAEGVVGKRGQYAASATAILSYHKRVTVAAAFCNVRAASNLAPHSSLCTHATDILHAPSTVIDYAEIIGPN